VGVAAAVVVLTTGIIMLYYAADSSCSVLVYSQSYFAGYGTGIACLASTGP